MKLKKTIVENPKPLASMILGLTIAGLGALAAFGGKKKAEEYDDDSVVREELEETENTPEEESEDETE